MRLHIPLLVAMLALSLTFAPKAEAADVSAVVARMDVIIKQMEALKAEFAALASSIPSAPSGAVLGSQSSAPVFTQSLQQGETNDDIKMIQKLLATDPEIYPYGVTSGLFGPKTEEGIKNFQTRFGLDPVGVVGPATKALLELFINAYPDGNYPTDVLKKKPQVAGASTSVPQPQTPVPTPTVPSARAQDIDEITAKYDGEEAKVKVLYDNDETTSFVIEEDSKIEVVDAVASKLGLTRAQVLGLIEFVSSGSSSSNDDDDFNIDLEIDDDEVSLSFEFDGDDYDVNVDSTDEDDVLDEVADELDEDEADDLDDDLVDAIKDALDEALDDEDDSGDSDEIDEITAEVADGEAQITVEYGNGDDEEFTVEEDYEPKIIEEVADELNIDESDVEDVIEFEYEDVDEINVDIKDGKAIATVEFEDGTTKRIKVDSDDEDDIIEAIAEELDEDESDVEDWTKFDYLD